MGSRAPNCQRWAARTVSQRVAGPSLTLPCAGSRGRRAEPVIPETAAPGRLEFACLGVALALRDDHLIRGRVLKVAQDALTVP
jgi:hypothetical protein